MVATAGWLPDGWWFGTGRRDAGDDVETPTVTMGASPLALLVAGASLLAAVGAASLVWYLRRHWGKAGANWFVFVLAAVTVFCAVTGVSPFVSDAGFRATLELVSFVSLCFMGPLFLGFGLAYTGRTDIVRGPLFGAAVAVPVATLLVGATRDSHGLFWTDFRLVSTFGVTVADYALGPFAWFAFGFGLAMTGVGVTLLVGAIVSYGSLYRREAVAVIVSIVPPTAGLLLWLLGVGPSLGLSLASALFLPHVLLDGYAFVGTHMFETNPTTQRAAEQRGLDGLAEPVLVVDTDDRVVSLNERATALFGVERPGDLPVPLSRLVGTGLDDLLATGEFSADGGNGSTFAVSHTPLSDATGVAVGSLVVFYDVTEERQREQQLAVLNRVLRHNLRNELTLVRGYAAGIGETVDDPGVDERAVAIRDASDRLLTISEKVQSFERVRDRDPEYVAVDVAALLAEVRSSFADRYPDATVTVDVGSGVGTLRTDRERLSLVVSTLVENALVHAEASPPTADVRAVAAGSGDAVRVEVRDRNRRIPDIEIASLRAGDETSLQHGQGIGLWVVKWCVTALNGEIEFDYDDGNIVAVTVPDVDGR